MAAITNTRLTYGQVNIQEDVFNVIENVDPVNTPFQSMCQKGRKPGNIYTEFLQDTNYTPVVQPRVEGDEASYKDTTPVARLGNYTQIFINEFLISGTADAIKYYGHGSAMAYQVMKFGKKHKQEIEIALLRNGGSNAGNATTPRQMAGVTAWITTNVNAHSSGANGGWQANTKLVTPRRMAAANNRRDVTEDMFRNLLTDIMVETDMIPKLLLVPIKQKAKISQIFTGVGSQQSNYNIQGRQGQALTAVSAVDYYRSDFGVVTIMPNRWMPENVLLCLNMSKWVIRYLRRTRVEMLAKTGDARKRMLISELTLCAKHEKANGLIADIK